MPVLRSTILQVNKVHSLKEPPRLSQNASRTLPNGTHLMQFFSSVIDLPNILASASASAIVILATSAPYTYRVEPYFFRYRERLSVIRVPVSWGF